MTDSLATSGPALSLYSIQLTEVHCTRAISQRRSRREADPDSPQLNVTLTSTGLIEEGRGFQSRIQVSIRVPVLDSELVDLQFVVVGTFASDAAIDPELHAAFSAHTPLSLLWPYARSYVSQLGLMLGIELPPLPLINARVTLGPTPDTTGLGSVPAED